MGSRKLGVVRRRRVGGGEIDRGNMTNSFVHRGSGSCAFLISVYDQFGPGSSISFSSFHPFDFYFLPFLVFSSPSVLSFPLPSGGILSFFLPKDVSSSQPTSTQKESSLSLPPDFLAFVFSPFFFMVLSVAPVSEVLLQVSTSSLFFLCFLLLLLLLLSSPLSSSR